MRVELPSSSTPRVSVIIPAMANSKCLPGCLLSLASFGPSEIPYETIVVLSEADETAESRWKDATSGVSVLRSRANLGIAGTGNRGRSAARGELLVLLHDDCEIEAGWMEGLVRAAEECPEAGAVGSRVLYPDGRLQNAGAIIWRNGSTSLPWASEPPLDAFPERRVVDYCGSSSLLIRAAAWDAAGGLDERFYPVYYVDVDLGLKLRRCGWTVVYEPTSRVRHHRGGSAGLHLRAFAGQRNYELFIEKWRGVLEEQEPFDPTSPEAIERAIERAKTLASVRGQRVNVSSTGPLDLDNQEQRHIEEDLAFHKLFAAHLSRKVDDLERTLEEMKARETARAQ